MYIVNRPLDLTVLLGYWYMYRRYVHCKYTIRTNSVARIPVCTEGTEADELMDCFWIL